MPVIHRFSSICKLSSQTKPFERVFKYTAVATAATATMKAVLEPDGLPERRGGRFEFIFIMVLSTQRGFSSRGYPDDIYSGDCSNIIL